ncbi:MAG TPA: ATP-grasp domain-containing protein, partial [Candidatus Limnocylindrales bacterium]|nr:ATP-grasp domain-containing protein [Candidatus Limnocylindrales bacterium]
GEGASRSALAQGFEALGGRARPLLLERELAFACELSVVCARGDDGRTLAFPVARNRHDEGILVESLAPAPVPDEVAGRAHRLAERLMAALDAVGVLTVELFLMPDGSLAVNELAPRVHNSGHWTLDGAFTDQFEQHIRAICGLPLGSVEPIAPAVAMVNLLGRGAPRPAVLQGTEVALADPVVRLHLYDKRQVFERRKMGHLTVAAVSGEDALARAVAARDALTWAD